MKHLTQLKTWLLLCLLFFCAKASAEATYTKVTDVAELSAGDVILLVYENGSTQKELSGISSSNPSYGIATNYTTSPNGAYELTLEVGSTSGSFAMKNGGDYLAWTSERDNENSLSTSTSKNKYSSWAITISEGNARICNVNTTDRFLQYYPTNPRFACYKDTQRSIQIYKKCNESSPGENNGESNDPGFTPQYTVSWSVNGTIKKTETVDEGTAVSAPNVKVCGNKVLYGWATTENIDPENPELVTPSATATQNITYYAVFATLASRADEETSTLTNDAISSNIMTTALGYEDSPRIYNDGKITWTVKGYSPSSGTQYIQIKNDKNLPTYIKIESPYAITRVSFDATNTINANFDGTIYLTTKPTTSPKDDSNVKGSVTINAKDGSITSINGSHSILYIQSNGAVRLSNIQVTYGTPAVYADYTTTIPYSTLSVKAQKWGTFVAPYIVTLPANVSAYTAEVSEGVLNLTKVADVSEEVPAATPVLLKNVSESQVSQTYYGEVGDNGIVESSNNDLKGYYAAGQSIAEGNYILQTQNGVQAFYKLDSGAYTSGANRCYLDGSKVADVKVVSFDGEETAIENIFGEETTNKNVYDLSGRKVTGSQKGIYIIGRRKIVK